jgi:hypothetical protein
MVLFNYREISKLVLVVAFISNKKSITIQSLYFLMPLPALPKSQQKVPPSLLDHHASQITLFFNTYDQKSFFQKLNAIAKLKGVVNAKVKKIIGPENQYNFFAKKT